MVLEAFEISARVQLMCCTHTRVSLFGARRRVRRSVKHDTAVLLLTATTLWFSVCKAPVSAIPDLTAVSIW